MNLELIRIMCQDLVAQKLTPRTILMTVEDAETMKLPLWTKELMGLKLVIAQNQEKTEVVPHIYGTVLTKKKKTDEEVKLILEDYQ